MELRDHAAPVLRLSIVLVSVSLCIMITWRPDPSALRRPVYLSLADQIGRAIADGRLGPGARLPTHRSLAEDLAVSVQTVSRAYDELIRRGLVSGETGRGSFVRAPRREPAPPYLPERLGGVIDLSILKPVTESLHVERLKSGLMALAEMLPPDLATSFRPSLLFSRHRAVAAEWLAACGLTVPAANIGLTNGATGAMTSALMTVAPPGSAVATEAIGHHTLVPLASYLGLRLVGVPIDDQGIVPEALDEACRSGGVKALFLEPTIVNPTATLSPLRRRQEIVEVARRHDLSIIENDVLGPLAEDRPPPVAALAPERTLYVTSFTKCVVPGLRIGYLAVPDRLVAAAANRHLVTSWMATAIMAELATRWAEEGTAMELVLWQREALRRRHAIAAEALAGIPHRAHRDGLHVWLPLPKDRSEPDFVSHARLQGVAIAPGESFVIAPEAAVPAVRISVGSTTEDELRRGLAVVSNLLHSDPEPVLLAH